ncbi:MAG: ATP-dependent metallopeptidase FtsH/Yme1/Tma family protein, partial [Bacteroidota bacterium]
MDEQKKAENGTRRSGESEKRRGFPRPGKKRGGQQFRPDDDFNWNKVLKVVLSWSAIILLVFLVMTLFKGTEASEVEVTYTEYHEFLENNDIVKATIKKSELTNYDFHGELREQKTVIRNSKSVPFKNFWLTLPILDSGVIKEWNDKGLKFTVVRE